LPDLTISLGENVNSTVLETDKKTNLKMEIRAGEEIL